MPSLISRRRRQDAFNALWQRYVEEHGESALAAAAVILAEHIYMENRYFCPRTWSVSPFSQQKPIFSMGSLLKIASASLDLALSLPSLCPETQRSITKSSALETRSYVFNLRKGVRCEMTFDGSRSFSRQLALNVQELHYMSFDEQYHEKESLLQS